MRVGIDLGGTKIEGVTLSDSGRELARRRVSTPRDDYDGTIRAIVELVGALEEMAGDRGSVGIGMPGTISPATGLVKNANSVWMIGRPLAQPRACPRDHQAWADAAKKWFVDGHHLEGDEMDGRIVFLGPDMKEELGEITLMNVGFKKFSSDDKEANSEKIARFTSELYVEKMVFKINTYDS